MYLFIYFYTYSLITFLCHRAHYHMNLCDIMLRLKSGLIKVAMDVWDMCVYMSVCQQDQNAGSGWEIESCPFQHVGNVSDAC